MYYDCNYVQHNLVKHSKDRLFSIFSKNLVKIFTIFLVKNIARIQDVPIIVVFLVKYYHEIFKCKKKYKE